MTLKTCSGYICNDGVQFQQLQMETRKLAFVVRVHQTMQNLVISRCSRFAEDGKEIYKDLSHGQTAHDSRR